jgi:hypothetical protein
MGWEDAAIGIGQGISQGVQNAGAIQNVWRDKAAMENEAKMAPLRLKSAENQAGLSTIQLAEEQRKQDILNRPFNYKDSEMYRILTPEMQKTADDTFKGLPATYAGMQEGIEKLSKHTAMMEGLDKIVQQEGGNRFQAKMAEVNAATDPTIKAQLTAEAQAIAQKTQSVKEQMTLQIDQNKISDAFKTLTPEEQKTVSPFLRNPKEFWTVLTKIKFPDMNTSYFEGLVKANKGDYAAATKQYETFELGKTKLAHDQQPRRMTATDVNNAEKQVGQWFQSRTDIPEDVKKKIRGAISEGIPVYSGLPPQYMEEFKGIQKEVLQLMEDKQAKNSVDALDQVVARKSEGKQTPQALLQGIGKVSGQSATGNTPVIQADPLMKSRKDEIARKLTASGKMVYKQDVDAEYNKTYNSLR